MSKEKKATLFFKRTLDVLASFFGLLLLCPVFAAVAAAVALDSPGGVFFRQIRVGKDGRDFTILKFRTMTAGQPKNGPQITVGADSRITKTGAFLRKTKLDELPQLINVLRGDMSLVGPRPEVPRYVEHYTPEQRRVLSVRPGITEEASLRFSNESELLGQSDDPEWTYIHEIMPEKLRINLIYVDNMSFFGDIKLIFKTIMGIFY